MQAGQALPNPGLIEQIRSVSDSWELPRRWEEHHPRALALLAAVVAGLIGLPHESVTRITSDVVPPLLTVTAILAGFAATAESLLLALMDYPIIKSLRDSGRFEKLVGYFREVGRSMGSLIAVATLVLVLQACDARLPLHGRFVPALLGGCFLWVCLSGVRTNRLIFKLLLKRDAR
jgi:hypothetical protein